MEYKDYYKIMGIERKASQEEIKRSYRKLARKYHPDVSKEANAEAKFKELGEAYEVLKDPEKRKKYDSFGAYWQGEQPHQGRKQRQSYQNFDDLGGMGSGNPFEDFLNSIFKERYQAKNQRGQDIHTRLAISLEDSFQGVEKTLQLQLPAEQSGGAPNLQTIKVKIPAGIGDKQQIRLKGKGEKGTIPGDLYIEISVLPHHLFSVQNKDIYVQLPITPWEAALGASIQVPTLGGLVNLKIPELSQTGKQLRLKGRGLPGSPAGDQYIILQIVIPLQENKEAEELYTKLASLFNFNPRSGLGS